MTKRYKILAVDDEPINIQLMNAALKGEYDVFTALNGFDAITQLKEHLPDLILLDVMMPDMNGFDVCSNIKVLDVMMPDMNGFDVCSNIKADASFADIPVIFLTALEPHDGELRGLEIGGTDYLTKPVNFELLKLRVRNHIALKQRNDLVREQRDLLAVQKEKLEASLARVKQLEGIIPICMYCKKIRDDKNTWNKLEKYISEHSEAKFSHGICPHCVEEQMEIINKM